MVAKTGKIDFANNRASNCSSILLIEYSIVNRVLIEILYLWNLKTNCSWEFVLWAMGALVKVNDVRFIGRWANLIDLNLLDLSITDVFK